MPGNRYRALPVYRGVESIFVDVRHAIRSLRNRPGFSLLAIVTLALGIGVNTVAFSALNGLLFKPQRFPEAARLAWIMTKAPGNAHGSTSLPDFEDFRRFDAQLPRIEVLERPSSRHAF